MPGHIGTSIVINSARLLGRDPKDLDDEQGKEARERMARLGIPVAGATPDQVRQALQLFGEGFRDQAPMSAAEAAFLQRIQAESGWTVGS